jgi:hypothetical protein
MSTKSLFTGLLFSAMFVTSCGPTIYKSVDLEGSKNKVKIVGVLPFVVSIDSRRLPKGVTAETLKESQQKTGYDMQNASYTWFLQRQEKYTVTFQDVDRTNALLKKANITYDNISLEDKGEICKLLGVDAVISGKAPLSKPMSEGGAIAMTFLVGFGGATNKTSVTLVIHDTKSSLLWKYDYEESGGIGSNSESLTKGLMKNASKKFPYKG